MDGRNIVAVYSSRGDAERARDRLIQFGIPDSDIQISPAEMTAGGALPSDATVGGTGAVGQTAAVRHEGFWNRLFSRDIPETHRGWYEMSLREGRTVLSVFARDEAQCRSIEDILDEFAPLEFETERTAALAAPQTAMTETAAPSVSLAGREGEQVIPVVKEELAIGKRASERRYRIHTYVVETPVENEVMLRDERVIVEHRPVAGERALGTAELPRERDYEIIERHEEPVVEKRVRAVEEVVVRKEADKRTEKVRDTVRETRVDVENEAATPASGEDLRNPPLPERRGDR